jgi:hypothetical protein
MENKSLMTIPLTDEKKENCWFVALLMSNFSTYTKNLILTKRSDDAGSLISIIKKLSNEYYYYNTKSLNFFHIITPEILLLKVLALMRQNDLRKFIIETKHFELPMSFMCDFHHSIAINCFKLMTMDNNNFYCELNDYYDLKMVEDKLSFRVLPMNIEAPNIKTSILTLLNDIPEMILIQKEKNTTEEAEVITEIIGKGNDYEKALNINNYKKTNDSFTFFDDIIIVNNNKYKLDTCIIKSSVNNSYLVLLHFDEKKMMYDISNGLLNENNWNLKTFVYNDYSYKDSPSIFASYINISPKKTSSLS